VLFSEVEWPAGSATQCASSSFHGSAVFCARRLARPHPRHRPCSRGFPNVRLTCRARMVGLKSGRVAWPCSRCIRGVTRARTVVVAVRIGNDARDGCFGPTVCRAKILSQIRGLRSMVLRCMEASHKGNGMAGARRVVQFFKDACRTPVGIADIVCALSLVTLQFFSRSAAAFSR